MQKDAVPVSVVEPPEPATPLAPLSVRIVLSALPGIALLWSQIWITTGLVDWSVGNLVLPGVTGVAIVGALTFGPALWASWRVALSAIESERVIAATV